MEYINEAEKNELVKLSENEVMKEAIKKILLADIYHNGTLEKDRGSEIHRNWVFGLVMNEMGQDFKQTDSELGAKLKNCIEGIRTVQQAFKKIEEYRPIKAVATEKKNPAR